ncbi:hypothetical protein BH23CYA1_BH23CYA1_21440 [soil metagenome]
MTATAPITSPYSITWPLLPDDFVLPDDPVENEAQPLLAAALTQALSSQPAVIKDALIVSNFALCAGINRQIIYFIPGLDLFLGLWEGTHEVRTGPWLRWWTAAGELVPWSEELVQQAQVQVQQAEARAQQAEQEKAALLAKLRAAGLE